MILNNLLLLLLSLLLFKHAWKIIIFMFIYYLPSVLLKLPVFVVEGAHLPRFEPPRDAVKVKGVVAHAPRDDALVVRVCRLIRLAFDARIHDMISANSARVDLNIPRPHCDSVPLFNFKNRTIGALAHLA